MMKKYHLLPLLIASSILMLFSSSIALAEQANETAQKRVIAVVNGQPLLANNFSAYVKMRINKEKLKGKLTAEQRNHIFGDYINRELIYQNALSDNLDKNPLFVTEMENQKRNIITGIRITQLLSVKASDEEMLNVYKKELSQPVVEYKTRHILLKTEQESKNLIMKLKNNGDFSKLAKENSIDVSGKNGGELNWFSYGQMIKPYSEAVRNLNKGAYTETPVKTNFGWHIIQLINTRQIPAPEFSEVREKVLTIVRNRRIAAYITKLRNTAEIEIK